MKTITFADLKANHACAERFAYLRAGFKSEEARLTLQKIYNRNGWRDALWATRCWGDELKTERVGFACACARRVLHIYEDRYPNDKRPRQAIEAAESGNAADNAANAAAYAAYANANAAYANDQSEEQWQHGKFCRVFKLKKQGG